MGSGSSRRRGAAAAAPAGTAAADTRELLETVLAECEEAAALPAPGRRAPAGGRCGELAAGGGGGGGGGPPPEQAAQRTTLTISAHRGTARSQQESPQYHTITRRKSSWQALSGNTAAEPNPIPREFQTPSWRPIWSRTAADIITPCTARQHRRGGLQRNVKCEGQLWLLGKHGGESSPDQL